MNYKWMVLSVFLISITNAELLHAEDGIQAEVLDQLESKLEDLPAHSAASTSSNSGTVLEQNNVKVEIFDFGANLDEPIAYTAQGKPFKAADFYAHGIRLVRLNVTNLGTQPIMINPRSVKASKISPKKVAAILQRANSITPWPYWESWGIYLAWAAALRCLNLDLPGLASWIGMPTGVTIPAVPKSVAKFGNSAGRKAEEVLPRAKGAIGILRRYCASLFDRSIEIPLISIFAFIMSARYLGDIERKNQSVLEVCQVLGGGNVRLIYPVLIQPDQTIQKVILLDQRKNKSQKVGIDIFAYNNKDIVASFEYQLHQITAAK